MVGALVWWMASATAGMPSVEYDVATGSDCGEKED
jgi:hypothetical protein